MKPFICLTLFVIACSSARAQPAEFAQEAAELSRGQSYYVAACARCHGVTGGGGEGPPLARAVLPRAPDDDALVAIIANGIPGSSMSALWWLSASEQRQVASFVRSLAPSGTAAQELLPGDPAAGRELYDRSGCNICHTIDGVGIAVGPDLTAVGLRRGADYLRASLVEPAASQPGGLTAMSPEFIDYLMVRAVDAEGNEVAGMRMNEDSYSIQLMDVAGRMHSLDKQSLNELDKQFDSSLMTSYQDTFSNTELDDLVSYLMTLTNTDQK